MKVALPVEEDRGELSPVHGHFGSARFFVIADPKDGVITTVENRDQGHQHGNCQPLGALGMQVDAVVVGGIGGGALGKLLAAGIKVYRAVEGTVKENLSLMERGLLPEFTRDQTCAGHAHGGGCHHH